ncbi:MAG: hypothetical protein ACPIA1_04745 [Flavobacteriaceae bacterium]
MKELNDLKEKHDDSWQRQLGFSTPDNFLNNSRENIRKISDNFSVTQRRSARKFVRYVAAIAASLTFLFVLDKVNFQEQSPLQTAGEDVFVTTLLINALQAEGNELDVLIQDSLLDHFENNLDSN